MKKVYIFLIGLALLTLAGCQDDAKVAKQNLSKAADNFEVLRRIVFYNTWTDTTMQVIEGKCSIEYGKRVSVICKVGKGANDVKNSLISLSGQVTVFVEQLESTNVSFYHYRRTFKPQSVIPDIDFRGDVGALLHSVTPDNND